jgi:hypothetical protein
VCPKQNVLIKSAFPDFGLAALNAANRCATLKLYKGLQACMQLSRTEGSRGLEQCYYQPRNQLLDRVRRHIEKYSTNTSGSSLDTSIVNRLFVAAKSAV